MLTYLVENNISYNVEHIYSFAYSYIVPHFLSCLLLSDFIVEKKFLKIEKLVKGTNPKNSVLKVWSAKVWSACQGWRVKISH